MDPNVELSRELSLEMIQIIDGYYPEFLADMGIIDSPIARVVFFKSMTEAITDDSMFPDDLAKELVLDELGVKLGVAFEDMLHAARQRFNQK